MTNESDELLFMIRRYVADRVDPELRDIATEGVVYSLTALMAEPRFYSQLNVVQRLQMENEMLRQQLAYTTAALARFQPVKVPTATKRPAKKRAAKKSAPLKVVSNPTIKVKGSTAANRRAFKQGYRGR